LHLPHCSARSHHGCNNFNALNSKKFYHGFEQLLFSFWHELHNSQSVKLLVTRVLTNDLNKSGWIIFAGAAPTPDTLGIQVVHRSVADANHEIGCGNTTQNLRLEEKQNYEIIMISRLVMKERQFLPCHHPGHLYHVQKNNSKLIPETNSFSIGPVGLFSQKNCILTQKNCLHFLMRPARPCF